MQVPIREKVIFPYKWKLSDGYPAKGISKHNTTVFSTVSIGYVSTTRYDG